MCIQHPAASASADPGFRFWIDEVLYSQGRPAVEVVEAVFAEAGGFRTGGPTRKQKQNLKHSDESALLGWAHAHAWELLWTKSTYAIRAVRALRPGQVVSAVVGLNSLTMKKRMLLTLKVSGNFCWEEQAWGAPRQLHGHEAHQ
jgi:hypothetical protein